MSHPHHHASQLDALISTTTAAANLPFDHISNDMANTYCTDHIIYGSTTQHDNIDDHHLYFPTMAPNLINNHDVGNIGVQSMQVAYNVDSPTPQAINLTNETVRFASVNIDTKFVAAHNYQTANARECTSTALPALSVLDHERDPIISSSELLPCFAFDPQSSPNTATVDCVNNMDALMWSASSSGRVAMDNLVLDPTLLLPQWFA